MTIETNPDIRRLRLHHQVPMVSKLALASINLSQPNGVISDENFILDLSRISELVTVDLYARVAKCNIAKNPIDILIASVMQYMNVRDIPKQALAATSTGVKVVVAINDDRNPEFIMMSDKDLGWVKINLCSPDRAYISFIDRVCYGFTGALDSLSAILYYCAKTGLVTGNATFDLYSKVCKDSLNINLTSGEAAVYDVAVSADPRQHLLDLGFTVAGDNAYVHPDSPYLPILVTPEGEYSCVDYSSISRTWTIHIPVINLY